MRFIVMHKVDANMEAGVRPSQEIIQNMGALVQGSLKQGVFLNGAGLHRSAKRARLTQKGGVVTRAEGPYAGQNELVASFVMIQAASLDDAVGHARTLARELGGDVEIEVGPVVEAWDLGFAPKPEGNPPGRFLLLCMATASDESGDTGVKHAAAVQRLSASFRDGAAVLAAESLAPSAKGLRLPAGAPEKRSWVDGPFAESKELIAGFSMLSLPSLAEARAWADRYAAILGGANEVDVRELNEP